MTSLASNLASRASTAALAFSASREFGISPSTDPLPSCSIPMASQNVMSSSSFPFMKKSWKRCSPIMSVDLSLSVLWSH